MSKPSECSALWWCLNGPHAVHENTLLYPFLFITPPSVSGLVLPQCETPHLVIQPDKQMPRDLGDVRRVLNNMPKVLSNFTDLLSDVQILPSGLWACLERECVCCEHSTAVKILKHLVQLQKTLY